MGGIERLGFHANDLSVLSSGLESGYDPGLAELESKVAKDHPEIVVDKEVVKSQADAIQERIYREANPGKALPTPGEPAVAIQTPVASVPANRIWFDPKDKDGYINIADADGSNYRRMSIEQARTETLVSEDTEVSDLRVWTKKTVDEKAAETFTNELNEITKETGAKSDKR